jgi:predicted nucleic acid-binding protein
MTTNFVVLDTNIVIDLLKKVPAVVERFLALVQAKTTFVLSPIVVAEVYAGALQREHKVIEALFDLCQRVELDSSMGRMAGVYANQFSKAFQGISLEDYFMAATAQNFACPLWTHNRKHYPMDDIELLTA